MRMKALSRYFIQFESLSRIQGCICLLQMYMYLKPMYISHPGCCYDIPNHGLSACLWGKEALFFWNLSKISLLIIYSRFAWNLHYMNAILILWNMNMYYVHCTFINENYCHSIYLICLLSYKWTYYKVWIALIQIWWSNSSVFLNILYFLKFIMII